MTTKQRLITALLVAALWLIVDQLTKMVFKHVLTPGDVVSLFAGSLVVFPIYKGDT